MCCCFSTNRQNKVVGSRYLIISILAHIRIQYKKYIISNTRHNTIILSGVIFTFFFFTNVYRRFKRLNVGLQFFREA